MNDNHCSLRALNAYCALRAHVSLCTDSAPVTLRTGRSFFSLRADSAAFSASAAVLFNILNPTVKIDKGCGNDFLYFIEPVLGNVLVTRKIRNLYRL